MGRRIEADDEVRRFTSVYLGPPGFDLPFHVRYSAYAVGGAVFLAILFIEGVLPAVSVGVPPIWELIFTFLITTVVMTAVDHDRPLASAVSNARNVAQAVRPSRDAVRRRRPTARHLKITKDPIHEAHEASSSTD